MIFDHENGNWKNSEVARNLLEILDSTASVAEESSTEDAFVLVPAVDHDAEVKLAHQELNEYHKASAAQLIISELNKIASSLGDTPKAALEVDLAVEDIKDIFK